MFIRSKNNPILKPNKKHAWEAKKVYNAGIIYNNYYHLFYRAVSNDWRSSIGYAVSQDGIKFKRLARPVLMPEKIYETRGTEDPRITKIDNTFFMTYTGYDGRCARLCLATSHDLKSWRKHGPILKNWDFIKAGGFIVPWDEARNKYPIQTAWSKAGAIFPKKINNQYLMLFGDSNIWFAYSKDGSKWQAKKEPFLTPQTEKYFNFKHLEMGPPPIQTSKGWLILYHGISVNKHGQIIYQLGYLLLNLNNPSKIIYRATRPIFQPTKSYRKNNLIDIAIPGGLASLVKMSSRELYQFIYRTRQTGIMPKVIFCCGALIKRKNLQIYYGDNDSVVATATTPLKNILNLVK